MRIGFTLYASRTVLAAVRGASSRAIFVSAVFETRNENKRGEYVPVIYARGALQLADLSVHPSAHPLGRTKRARRALSPHRNGLRFRVCGVSMLITIVCSTIRLKCTFINRIHRGYLSGCRTISPWIHPDLPAREKLSQWRMLCRSGDSTPIRRYILS